MNATIIRAAELLESDADSEQASCAVGEKEWACSDCPINAKPRGICPAKISADERRKVAAKLRKLTPVR